MNNQQLKEILIKKEITTDDQVIFRTIFDVLSALFTDQNQTSLLKIGYKINDKQELWFPNISTNKRKTLDIQRGYANYLAPNWNYIYQFNESQLTEKRQKMAEKYQKNKTQFVTFAKLNEKENGIGYHFLGVFVFDHFLGDDYQTMVYKKISDRYKL